MPTLRYANKELHNDFRAILWQQFAVLERSGIPVLQALPILADGASAAFRTRLERFLSLLRGGLAMSEAGRRSGVWLPWEADVLAAAEQSGRRDLFYQRLAQYYSERANSSRKLKTRLVYPYAILILAVVLGPLPALARGSIDGVGYLLQTLIPLGLLFSSQVLLSISYRQWRAGLRGVPRVLNSLAFFRRQQRRDCLALLALLLQAGVAAHDACARLCTTLHGAWLQQRLQRAQAALHNGANLSKALLVSDLLPDLEAQQLIATGEAAGKLDAMLQHIVERLDRQLHEQLDLLAEWLPRLVYALIVGFVISRLL